MRPCVRRAATLPRRDQPLSGCVMRSASNTCELGRATWRWTWKWIWKCPADTARAL
jgi:hypothetical protein